MVDPNPKTDMIGKGETMKELSCFERPANLEEGKAYLLRLSPNGEHIPLFTQVSFLGYTSCPAVVMVQDARRAHLRYNLDDLFYIANQ